MVRALRPLLFSMLLMFAGSASVEASERTSLIVGAAKLDITPRDLVGLNPMPGEFTGVHDALYLRALVVSNADTKIAILVGDLIEAGDMTPVRQRIERELGIPGDHIIMTATHDHSAPRIGDVSPGALAHAGGPESKKYSEFVYDKMIEALRQASASAKPARIGHGVGTVDVNVNRHLYTDEGWTLGVNPDGVSDKNVRVTRFDDLDGNPIAVLFNYAVHSTVTIGLNRVSGDLAGSAARHVENRLGHQAVALFTLGAVGDQAPRYFKQPQSGNSQADLAFAYEAMEAQGFMIGAEVLRVSNAIRTMADTVMISAAERVISCPAKAGADVMDSMKQQQVDKVDLRLSMLRINDIVYAGVGGEVVTPIYNRLEEASPLKNTVLISIANDRIGYIPDDAMFDTPVFAVKGSPVARGCAEDGIVNGFVEMINSTLLIPKN